MSAKRQSSDRKALKIGIISAIHYYSFRVASKAKDKCVGLSSSGENGKCICLSETVVDRKTPDYRVQNNYVSKGNDS